MWSKMLTLLINFSFNSFYSHSSYRFWKVKNGVLDCSGGHNKMPQTGWLKHKRTHSHFQRPRSPRLERHHGLFPVGDLHPAGREPLPVVSHVAKSKNKNNFSGISPWKATNSIMRAPSSWLSLTLITSQRPHIQIPSQGRRGRWAQASTCKLCVWCRTHSVHSKQGKTGWNSEK